MEASLFTAAAAVFASATCGYGVLFLYRLTIADTSPLSRITPPTTPIQAKFIKKTQFGQTVQFWKLSAPAEPNKGSTPMSKQDLLKTLAELQTHRVLPDMKISLAQIVRLVKSSGAHEPEKQQKIDHILTEILNFSDQTRAILNQVVFWKDIAFEVDTIDAARDLSRAAFDWVKLETTFTPAQYGAFGLILQILMKDLSFLAKINLDLKTLVLEFLDLEETVSETLRVNNENLGLLRQDHELLRIDVDDMKARVGFLETDVKNLKDWKIKMDTKAMKLEAGYDFLKNAMVEEAESSADFMNGLHRKIKILGKRHNKLVHRVNNIKEVQTNQIQDEAERFGDDRKQVDVAEILNDPDNIFAELRNESQDKKNEVKTMTTTNDVEKIAQSSRSSSSSEGNSETIHDIVGGKLKKQKKKKPQFGPMYFTRHSIAEILAEETKISTTM